MKEEQKAYKHHYGLIVANCLFAIINFGLFFYVVCRQTRNFSFDPDAVSLTAITILLTVLTIFLAIGALYGFYLLRSAAVLEARDEARTRVGELFSDWVKEYANDVRKGDSAINDALIRYSDTNYDNVKVENRKKMDGDDDGS